MKLTVFSLITLDDIDNRLCILGLTPNTDFIAAELMCSSETSDLQ